MKQSIVVVGSSNTDMVVKSSTIPAIGQTVTGGDFFLAQGGKGANQAVAAARLGADVTFVSRIGNDVFGSQAVAEYEKEGINVNYIVQDSEKPTGVALILVDSQGRNLISVASGANHALSIDDVKKAEAVLGNAKVIVMQLETPITVVEYVCNFAAERGIPVLLDPAPAPNAPIADTILKNLAYIKPNETEASMLTGVPVDDLDFPTKAADILLSKGVMTVLITLGEKGTYISTVPGEGFYVPAKTVVAEDTTAAGDQFSGAFAVAIAEGRSLHEAVEFATKAAAISVSRRGAQPSLARRSEIED